MVIDEARFVKTVEGVSVGVLQQAIFEAGEQMTEGSSALVDFVQVCSGFWSSKQVCFVV
jgi:hypothetical protein